MLFQVTHGSIIDAECDALVVNLFEGVKEPSGATGALNQALDGAIASLIERQGFEGKLCQIADLTPSTSVNAARIIIVGLGKQEDFDADKARAASSAAARRARELSAKRVATALHGAGSGGLDLTSATRSLVEGAILGTYEFSRHKTEGVKPNSIEYFEIIETDETKLGAIRSSVQLASIVAQAICFSRDLTNEPANILTPSQFAQIALDVAEEFSLGCRVIDEGEIGEIGMNLLLAVAKGSVESPKFVDLRYLAPGAEKTVALIGKGVTFDSGGLNLKPGGSMAWMKDDMSGAAAVLAAMRAIAQLKPKINVVALMPVTENMIGGNAIRPGDVIQGLSGKTVEIDNTDAEGRLIISDALAFAEREQVDEMVDVATLTGACVVALGREIAGVFGSDQRLVDRLVAAGKEGGELLWQMPLHASYEDSIKSDVADSKNAGGREGGAIIGALFIRKHIGDTPWAHIDIAGPATIESQSQLSTKGATGFGVSTLINYLLASAK